MVQYMQTIELITIKQHEKQSSQHNRPPGGGRRRLKACICHTYFQPVDAPITKEES